MKRDRHYSFVDRVCLKADQVVRTLADNAKTTDRACPAALVEEQPLTERERQVAAALMRVNHAGEVCAQALYHGQALVSRQAGTQKELEQAALEEGDHLMWCKNRLEELGSHTSYLGLLWYSGSFCIGMVAGMVGDKWSLGFVAETERQVVKHLEGHIHKLPDNDKRSHAILTQMAAEEACHRDGALALGGRELPGLIKTLMAMLSKLMVKTAYWV